MNRSDTLAVSVYARHGDTCGLEDSYGHHDSLGCASGFKSNDMVLVARFAYLQEAIDYCQQVGTRGVNTRLVSRIVPNSPYVSEYPKVNHNWDTHVDSHRITGDHKLTCVFCAKLHANELGASDKPAHAATVLP